MKLFIANTNKQNEDFTYRLPEEKNFRVETIRAGTQTMVGGKELTQVEVATIIEQKTPYGLRDARQLSSLKDYVGLSFSLDRPVPLDSMIVLFEQNDERLNERAGLRLEKAMAAIADNAESLVRDAGLHLQNAEVEVVEQTTGGAAPKLSAGLEVVGEGGTSRRAGKPGRRGRANA